MGGSSAGVSVTVSNGTTDTANPTCSITDPEDEDTVSGSQTITVTANDNDAVKQVAFFIDGICEYVDDTSPYTHAWTLASS